MDDLVTWLRAQLDEAERVALAAGNRNWLVEDNTITLWPEAEDDGYMSWPTRADARHAAEHDPARVLREVAAKRAIVDAYVKAHDGVEDYEIEHYIGVGAGRLLGLEVAVRHLAAVYSDRDGYRPEWAPDPSG